MYRVLLLASVVLSLPFGSSVANAHSRWFLAGETPPAAPPLTLDIYYIAMLALVLLAVRACLRLTERAAGDAALARMMFNPLRVPGRLDWRLLSIALGILLVVNSTRGVLVAPNLVLGEGPLSAVAGFGQALIGAMLILGTRVLVASAVVAAAPLLCWLLFSFGDAIDYAFELAGIGAALFLVAPLLTVQDRELRERLLKRGPFGLQLTLNAPSRSYRMQWQSGAAPGDSADAVERAAQQKRQAAAILRVALGLQLIVLAAHDKLLYPEVSLAFVDRYSFVNFPALLGLSDFTNLHFVIGAGLVEAALGVLLIGNIAVRPACLFLTFIFVLTGFMFGMGELIGHVPIVAALLVLIAEGSPVASPAARLRTADTVGLRSAGAATAAVVAGAFMLSGPTASGTVASGAAAINAATVPAVLYSRFAEARPGDLGRRPELARADAAVRSAIAAAASGKSLDKDDLARRLFELSVRYEAEHGADAASLWLRYAHLTASCTRDELLAFRALVSSLAWVQLIEQAPASLAGELVPIARRSAEAILQRPVAPADGALWQAVANAAPSSGELYIHTHTLAAIARILEAAVSDSAVSRQARLDRG